ncbi:tigger transposable element-derived protein 1-like [Portunus trituberculatus]|uniref:tigger transposable element-derived protein 1-like n=1 Tax=Portunus trituberculatus TaxID=210409 RepID=UPI001E1CBB4C|nr:tigger transposable element-derived protein 1-like [Portunus trituberculatus]
MAPKRPSSSPGTSSGPPAKKMQRKSLTLAKKMEILSRYDQGQKTSIISHALGLGESTLGHVRDNAAKIQATVEAGSSRTLQRVAYSRSSAMERMEKMLATWIQHQNKTSIPVSSAIIQEKAKSLINDIEGNDRANTSFQASSGWFAKFKLRHGFHNIKMTGEAASADTESAKKFPEMLKKTLEEGQYSSKQVFNVDETSLYWKMPARTYIAQEEKTAPGFKASKDRLTLLLGTNAEGDCRLKPVLIYHSQNPRALKRYDRAFLPVHWYANKKGWMTGKIFSDYYKNKLHSELKAYCNKEGIPFKILLLVDIAPSHPASLENLSNIKLAFLPPNTTSLLQPCDQGLIQMFKSYYLRSTNEENKTLRDFWKNFTIKDAVTFIKQSWAEVPTKCLNGVWKKLCPQFVHSFKAFNVDDIVSKANKDTISYAQDLGLDEVEEEDIDQLLQSHRQELSNEDLLDIEAENKREREEAEATAAADKAEGGQTLTATVISEALGKIKEGFAMLEEHDPNVERSTTITRKLTEEEEEVDDPEAIGEEVEVDVPEEVDSTDEDGEGL